MFKKKRKRKRRLLIGNLCFTFILMNCCNLKYGYANSQGRAAWLTCVRLLIRRNNIFFGLVRPRYTLADFATRGSEVNSVLREWRGKFFFPPCTPVLSFWACFVPLAFSPLRCLWRTVHWLFEVASKRKWGEKSVIDFAFCLTQTLRTEKHIRSQVLAVGQLCLLCERQRWTRSGAGRGGGVADWKAVEGEEQHQTTQIHLSPESCA